jgi:hypothetical protein
MTPPLPLLALWLAGPAPEAPGATTVSPATTETSAPTESATATETANAGTAAPAAPVAAPAGAPPGADPNAPPPEPRPPPDGVAAVGSGAQAPLPPPPPPVDPSTISQGPWRGRGWVTLRLTLGGPMGGKRPARADAIAIGGAGEVGWRLANYLGLATGISRQPHDRSRRWIVDEGSGAEVPVLDTGHLTAFDFAIVRGYWPVDGRVQPHVDLGGGLGLLEPPDPDEVVSVGGQIRAGAGLDAWIARTVTLDGGVLYRASFLAGTVGHQLSGYVGIGLHW